MSVDIDLGPELAAFRADVRAWLDAHKPDKAPKPGTPEYDAWAETMQHGGYLCPAWPREYGGGGLDGVKLAVLNEEFQRARVPRVTRGMGESLVGPSIIVHGTEDQKQRLLPRILSNEDRYCQGFSEPDSGSDLASLKTRGVVVDGEVIITGQKVWTSGYWAANMMFCLARTNPDAPKHQGISYILIPLKHEDGSPNGIEFAPLKQMTGRSGFAVSHITEARVPLENVIGGLNNGWRVAMTTLGNERGGSATTQHLRFRKQFWDLVDDLRAADKTSDPIVRQHIAWAYTHVEIMRFLGLRLITALASGRDPGPSASINKAVWSEYNSRLTELATNILGPSAIAADDGLIRWTNELLAGRSNTIWGGTAEIQRNIMGERVLGLPKDPEPATPG